jgi:thymidylate synthase (FAD)
MKVLNDGYVELVDYMGSDLKICQTARVSTGAEADKGKDKNRKLIRYLYKNDHLTPFESCVFTFSLRSPLFVAQQILRHRTFSFNVESARYKKFEWNCYKPKEWRYQDDKNKQGSGDILFDDEIEELNENLSSVYDTAKFFYNDVIDYNKIAREQARAVMPMGMYTSLFLTTNLRNLLHFLELRLHSHAQYETRVYAEAILKTLDELDEFKFSIEIFKEVLEVKYLLLRAINKKDKLFDLTKHLENF